MSDSREIAIDNIMKLVPCKGQFERMVDLSPSEMKEIVRTKPVFPYTREQVGDMTQEEFCEAFAKWDHDRYGYGVPTVDEEMDEDTMYQKFRDWNLKCLNGMYEDEFEHLEWLCDRIANKKVRNLDIEDCGEFLTGGIYFNKDKHLVIFNGR